MESYQCQPTSVKVTYDVHQSVHMHDIWNTLYMKDMLDSKIARQELKKGNDI